MSSRFRSLIQLADRLEAAYAADRVSKLTPQTAYLCASALRAWCSHPDRDAVALALCDVKGRCPKPCMTCVGRANIVSRMYCGRD